MRCPFCKGNDTKVIDSRDATDMHAIRRRRECLSCRRRFTTFETVELVVQVKKRNGIHEDFSEQKLIEGLSQACRHTTIGHDQVLALATRIKEFFFHEQRQVISSKEIGERVMEALQELDLIAYIRFACVYRRFTDIGQLIIAIREMYDIDKTRDHRIQKSALAIASKDPAGSCGFGD